MRFLVLVLLAACDLQPPKRERPAPPAPAVRTDGGPGAGAGTGTAPTDDECTTVAVHLADKLIAAATDDAERAVLVQDRTKLIRTAARNCTSGKWSEAARKCFLEASTKQQIETCSNTHLPKTEPAEPVPPPAPNPHTAPPVNPHTATPPDRATDPSPNPHTATPPPRMVPAPRPNPHTAPAPAPRR